MDINGFIMEFIISFYNGYLADAKMASQKWLVTAVTELEADTERLLKHDIPTTIETCKETVLINQDVSIINQFIDSTIGVEYHFIMDI